MRVRWGRTMSGGRGTKDRLMVDDDRMRRYEGL